jgi:hypothetical protein
MSVSGIEMTLMPQIISHQGPVSGHRLRDELVVVEDRCCDHD